MGKFMIGDRISIKTYVSDSKPRIKMTGTIAASYGRWYTVKHDNIDIEDVRRSGRTFESHIGPRYDYQEDDLDFESPLLKLVNAVSAPPIPEERSHIEVAIENVERLYGHLKLKRRRKAS